MEITILGCGTSAGVPVIGCDCSVCKSYNPKNKRLRAGILVRDAHTHVLVDTTPDLRMQALQNDIKHIDGVIYTHAHADHINGIDELRSFNSLSCQEIPIYANRETLHELQQKFSYCFIERNPEDGWYYKPCLVAHEVKPYSQFNVGTIKCSSFNQMHGNMNVLGLRFGNVAYSTDLNFLPPESYEWLSGVHTWIVDCLGYTPHRTHAHLEQTLAWINKIAPKQAILTHMSHEIDYDDLMARLPANVCLAYDQMVVRVHY